MFALRLKRTAKLTLFSIIIISLIIITKFILNDSKSQNLKPIVTNVISNLIEKKNKTIRLSIENVLNKTNLKFFSVNYNNLRSKKKLSYRLSSSERLWFMINGSLRPDLKQSEELAIWPNEGDLNDDRVINQLMFVPLDYSQQNSKFKTIYMYGYNDWFIPYGKNEFAACPVNSCEIVNQSYASNADLIFFKV
jgi:hypothetical protein